jgi:hypothetical protein
LEEGSFTGKFERQMKKGSGYGPSLSMGARGYWREESSAVNSVSYARHVKEGFANGASLCSYGLCDGNLEKVSQY